MVIAITESVWSKCLSLFSNADVWCHFWSHQRSGQHISQRIGRHATNTPLVLQSKFFFFQLEVRRLHKKQQKSDSLVAAIFKVKHKYAGLLDVLSRASYQRELI